MGAGVGGSAHVPGRELAKLGHEAKFIPPAHVIPFAKRRKNDAAVTETICVGRLRQQGPPAWKAPKAKRLHEIVYDCIAKSSRYPREMEINAQTLRPSLEF